MFLSAVMLFCYSWICVFDLDPRAVVTDILVIVVALVERQIAFPFAPLASVPLAGAEEFLEEAILQEEKQGNECHNEYHGITPRLVVSVVGVFRDLLSEIFFLGNCLLFGLEHH